MIQHFYVAFCSNRDDPEKRGRIRVRCPTMVRSSAELPDWVEPMSLRFGELDVPEVNELIEIVVDQTDEQYDSSAGETFHRSGGKAIKWRPISHSTDAGKLKLPALLRADYPHRRGTVSRKGHWFYMGDYPDERQQLNSWGHRKGHRIDQHPDGSITIHATDGSTLQLLVTERGVLLSQADGASVHLTPTEATLMGAGGETVTLVAGTVTITAATIALAASVATLLGAGASTGTASPGASSDGSPIARYKELKAHLDALQAYVDAHGHHPGSFTTAVGGGPVTGVSGKPQGTPTSPGATGSSPVPSTNIAARSRTK